MELLPWHGEQWRKLSQRLRDGVLPHALLLSGPAGLGKVQFAAYLARTLLCETGIAQGRPCGQCQACVLFAAHNHPDLWLVSPLEEGKVIGVDQVREVGRYLAHTAQYGGHKVVIITPAEQMNLNAANSLLKTLEEPAAASLLVLVSDSPGRLPATVRSRCQRLTFTPPAAAEGRQWLAGRIPPDLDPELLLALAEGAPLRALALAAGDALPAREQVIQTLTGLAQGQGNPSAAAEQFLKLGARQTLYWIYQWVADMIRHHAGGEGHVLNRDLWVLMTKQAQRIGWQGLHAFMPQVNEALRLTEGQVNPQLVLENVLMAWQDAFVPHD